MKTIESKSTESTRSGQRPRRFPVHARGQFAVVFALASVALVGVMALGADIGVLYYNWGQLQKAADAAALAGASYLPNDVTTANSTATSYLASNGVQNSDVVNATPINSNTQMQITISRTIPYSFARVLGLTSGVVKVMSTASIPPAVTTVNGGPQSPISCGGSNCTSGGSTVTAGSGSSGSGVPFSGSCGTSGTGEYNVLPIALDNQTPWISGSTTTLNQVDSAGKGKGGGWPDAPGNWGYVNLCGGSSSSGSVLRTSMADGYAGELTQGNYLTTVPGVKGGPVQQGLSDRAPTTATAAPSSFDATDPRAVVIPLVDFSQDALGGACTGVCNVKITGFMAVYILKVNGGAITVQDVGLVIPNAVGSINATNEGAMGDIVLVH